jgi:hypothetical protein
MKKKKQTEKDKQAMRKRSLGIATAQSKQYGDKRSMGQRIRGEEVELDEVSSATINSYVNKRNDQIDAKRAAGDRAGADRLTMKKWKTVQRKADSNSRAAEKSGANAKAREMEKKMPLKYSSKMDHYVPEGETLDEKLNPSMGAGEYVKDFRDSDAPQFKGKSDKKKQKMAIAAYLSAKRGEK